MSSTLALSLANSNESASSRLARKLRLKNEKIAGKFGYTAEDNPFNDPNLTEGFTWKKKVEKEIRKVDSGTSILNNANGIADETSIQASVVCEIESVRSRRQERADALLEMDRLKDEESRLREMGNFDDWRRKEEEFHAKQQAQRQAIRLVQGREKPVDVLAKGVLFFESLRLEQGEKDGYSEGYDALREVKNLEVEVEAPGEVLKDLKLAELEGLRSDVREVLASLREVKKDKDTETTTTAATTKKEFDQNRYWEVSGRKIGLT